MAESSMKDIKLRIRSVQSTMQITKAMQLVATSKMRRSKERMENSKPYARVSAEAIAQAAASLKGGNVPFVTPRAEVKRRCYVVIAGDRGLAGGYNANVFKAVAASAEGYDYCVLPVGRKAIEKYQHLGVELLSDDFFPVAGMPVARCYGMASLLTEGYLKGQFDEVWLVSTDFRSMMTQEVAVQQLLPVVPAEPDEKRLTTTEYEPSAESVLEKIVPGLLAGQLYSAVCDAGASENAARRNAMDSATKNADAMISSLQLKYNRARQGSITQEITEIVAGSEK